MEQPENNDSICVTPPPFPGENAPATTAQTEAEPNDEPAAEPQPAMYQSTASENRTGGACADEPVPTFLAHIRPGFWDEPPIF